MIFKQSPIRTKYINGLLTIVTKGEVDWPKAELSVKLRDYNQLNFLGF